MPIGRTLIAIVTCVLATLALPARSHALFHISVIDEMLASIDGDPEQQFLEVKMLFAAQNLTKNADLPRLRAHRGRDAAEVVLRRPGRQLTSRVSPVVLQPHS